MSQNFYPLPHLLGVREEGLTVVSFLLDAVLKDREESECFLRVELGLKL